MPQRAHGTTAIPTTAARMASAVAATTKYMHYLHTFWIQNKIIIFCFLIYSHCVFADAFTFTFYNRQFHIRSSITSPHRFSLSVAVLCVPATTVRDGLNVISLAASARLLFLWTIMMIQIIIPTNAVDDTHSLSLSLSFSGLRHRSYVASAMAQRGVER